MRRTPWISLPLWVVAALVVGAVFRFPLVTDDPYITYRYARNLISGVGFVYNAGERMLSTTTPLYTMVLAAGGLASLDIPTLGYWLSVVSFGVGAWIVYLNVSEIKALGMSLALLTGSVAGALYLVSPAVVITFGLETGFYLMLGLGALHCFNHGRVVWAFVLTALLTLTRNDGLVLSGLMAVTWLVRNRADLRAPFTRDRARILFPFGVYVAILVPWLLFAWVYFGSPFPFTLAAKVAQAQSGLWDSFVVGLVKWARDNAVWLAPRLLLGTIGLVWVIRVRASVWMSAAWAGLHLLAYGLLGVAFYPWYIAPLMPALAIMAAIGMAVCAMWLAARLARGKTMASAVVLVLGLAFVALEVYSDVVAGITRPSPKVEAYQRAADWLARNTPPNATVDALEVGVIGYFDERRTLDFVGLVDPERVPYLRTRQFADGVRRAAADYVIAIPPDTWLPENVWFKDAYRPAEEMRVDGFYSGQPLVIYERADAAQAVSETIPLEAAFEKRVVLQEVGLYGRTVKRGERLPVLLRLRAPDSAPVPETWKFTLQLVGEADQVVAQTDNFFPVRSPTRAETFDDHQAIPIPDDAPPGAYRLILAMYDSTTNERLSFYDPNGNEAGDFLDLGNVGIE